METRHRLVAVDAGGTRVAIKSREFVQQYDARTGAPYGPPITCAFDGRAMDYSPDASYLAIGGDRDIDIWDAKTAETALATLDMGSKVSDFAFDPRGRFLAVAVDGEVRFVDPTTGGQVFSPAPHPDQWVRLALSHDGALLATRTDEYVRMWDIGLGRTIGVDIPDAGGPDDIAFHPTEGVLAVATGPGVAFWDVATGLPYGLPMAVPGGALELAFSAGGRQMFTAGGASVLKRELPSTPSSVTEMEHRTSITTGMRVDADGTPQPMGGAEWRALRGEDTSSEGRQPVPEPRDAL